ncbi:glycosyltransferase family 2 protein [Campylobacter lari]|uniref:glycosyltransferase family 2 protein n=1 Tax=Campylobacter lari TaxID=201 RepID=UPI00372C1691
MNNPLISIIIPIYNVAPYLKKCLDSVINQTYKNLDIILVDDGSDDESLDIAINYLDKDERIFLISKENGGLSSARNTGIEFIKGTKLRAFFEKNNEENIISFKKNHTLEKNTKIIKEEDIKSNFKQIKTRYIKTELENINSFIIQELPNSIIHFLDSDDYLVDNCIELCVKQMIEKNLDICAHGFKEYHEEKNQFIENPNTDLIFKSKKYFYKNAIDMLKENDFIYFYFAWQGLFKTTILNKYNLRFTHGIYHEDHDFGTILFYLANKVFYIKKSLMIYRIRQGSITNFNNKKIPEKLPKYLESLRKYFTNYIELRKYFKTYCFLQIAKQLYFFNIKLKDEFLNKSIKEYYYIFFENSIKKDPLKLNDEMKIFIKHLKLFKTYMTLRTYFRHPKKLFGIKHE